MALATAFSSAPWVANVFFAYDKHCNLFFFSKEDTVHCKNILKNPEVAVGIHQFSGKPLLVKGLQLRGKAKKVKEVKYVKSFALYLKRYPWAVRFLADHVLYKIEPTEIYYIDQELFGHFNRVRVK